MDMFSVRNFLYRAVSLMVHEAIVEITCTSAHFNVGKIPAGIDVFSVSDDSLEFLFSR